MTKFTLSEYRPSDCNALIELFYNTVHSVNSRHYSKEQLNVWATGNENCEEWNSSFLRHYTVVAEKDGVIAGFGDISNSGYLDRLYVHRDYQSMGIASAICDRLEQAAGVPEITVHASITAKGFFEKRGYRIIKEQQVERRGILLTNYVMKYTLNEKHLV